MKISWRVIVYLLSAGNAVLFSVEGAKGQTGKGKCLNEPVSQIAYVGGSVSIECKYPRGKENTSKHFSKETENDALVLIESLQSRITKKDRFSLENFKEKDVYVVSIFELRYSDAGMYVCASGNDGGSCVTEIDLQISSWDDIEPHELSGVASNTVRIDCSYPDKYGKNEKFLCQGENPTNCEKLIQTPEQGRTAEEGRFRITDDPQTKSFFVEIKDLVESDSGTYWCGFGERLEPDSYSRILLSVDTVSLGLPPSAPTSSIPGSSPDIRTPSISNHLLTLTAENGRSDDTEKKPPKSPREVQLIVLIVVFVCVSLPAVYMYRLCKRRRAGARADESPKPTASPEPNVQAVNEDHNYEEISFEKRPTYPLPSLYATASAPLDQLHCQVVEKDKVTDANTNQTVHPVAPVLTVYSTIQISEEPICL